MLDVGAGDIEFHGTDVRRGPQLGRYCFIFFLAKTGCTGDHWQFRIVLRQPWQLFLDHVVNPGIVQTIGIQPAGRRFTGPWRRIAFAWLTGG